MLVPVGSTATMHEPTKHGSKPGEEQHENQADDGACRHPRDKGAISTVIAAGQEQDPQYDAKVGKSSNQDTRDWGFHREGEGYELDMARLIDDPALGKMIRSRTGRIVPL
jgi:hypothetical protein